MAAEAEASREARAKVIAADGEMRASKALREASNIIDESPSALQLRYLQVCFVGGKNFDSEALTLTRYKKKTNSTAYIIFADIEFNSSREKLHNNLPGSN